MFPESKETKKNTDKKCVKTEDVLEKIQQSKRSFVQNSLLCSSLYTMFVVMDGVGNSAYASAFVWRAEYLKVYSLLSAPPLNISWKQTHKQDRKLYL